jgi:hypothetical protein
MRELFGIIAKVFVVLIFLMYLLVGLYLVNFSFLWVPIPKGIKFLENWVLLAGGVLVIISGIKYLLSRNHMIFDA